jgi:hypothetical protein
MRLVTSILLCAASAAGCRATENRPVVERSDTAELWSLLRRPAPASASVTALDLIVRPRVRVVEEVAPHPAMVAPALATQRNDEVDSASDSTPARVDLGLPILVDFGVVEAPYDDGTSPLHRGAVGSGGFSGSVLSVLWRRPLPRGLVLQGQACLVRDQDLSLLDGLGDARFGFAVVGLSVSF